jgi:hypothetical protein
MIHPIYLVVEFATNVTKPGHPLDGIYICTMLSIFAEF